MKIRMHIVVLLTLSFIGGFEGFELPNEAYKLENLSWILNESDRDRELSYRTEPEVEFIVKICDHAGKVLGKVPLKANKTINHLLWSIHFATGFEYPKETLNLQYAYNIFKIGC
jgi:hypothetical protein